MKFSTIFLTTAALAQNQVIVTRQDGSSNPVDATPGACRGLGGDPINGLKVPPGLALQFFDGEGCKGHQLGTGIGKYFVRYGNPIKIKSVKVVNEHGPTPNNAAYYYGYPGNANGDYYFNYNPIRNLL
ncbi:hypothetical protein CONCODRAFT_169257 [Conidiobolus coronatus NRRL 28638]|uniref:Uncharacterized protein n=1 Tax=Conidiobolus coronatus (strain ATCC 28846 / CBS 209.66 / NRRL 28638) TaxID=796925 RepID=A0A137NS69_CONC2|nr:hypothetical protein CONCODRAFT_169257 [Conidiobolus coronatus NRRL 28638]|eukprot:KXN65574.1 hypothetical protein CONCODRAFT_169257 [Conidiobolus coronatus NRRL 28638]